VRAGFRSSNSAARTDNSLSHAPILPESRCFRKGQAWRVSRHRWLVAFETVSLLVIPAFL
jgi:hypothetical protein